MSFAGWYAGLAVFNFGTFMFSIRKPDVWTAVNLFLAALWTGIAVGLAVKA